jgi:hypothetical protein
VELAVELTVELAVEAAGSLAKGVALAAVAEVGATDMAGLQALQPIIR